MMAGGFADAIAIAERRCGCSTHPDPVPVGVETLWDRSLDGREEVERGSELSEHSVERASRVPFVVVL